MTVPNNRTVSFHDAFKKDGEYWGLSEENFEILKKKNIKVLMVSRETHNEWCCDQYVIFKIETPKLKTKYMILYDRKSSVDILKTLIRNEINPENGKFQGQENWKDELDGGIIVKKGKGRIIKFIDDMFKRNVFTEVNSGGFQAFSSFNDRSIKSYLNCSIFDEEFYNMLSKKFNINPFEFGRGVPNHHSLSRNVLWRKYVKKQYTDEEGKIRMTEKWDLWSPFTE